MELQEKKKAIEEWMKRRRQAEEAGGGSRRRKKEEGDKRYDDEMRSVLRNNEYNDSQIDDMLRRDKMAGREQSEEIEEDRTTDSRGRSIIRDVALNQETRLRMHAPNARRSQAMKQERTEEPEQDQISEDGKEARTDKMERVVLPEQSSARLRSWLQDDGDDPRAVGFIVKNEAQGGKGKSVIVDSGAGSKQRSTTYNTRDAEAGRPIYLRIKEKYLDRLTLDFYEIPWEQREDGYLLLKKQVSEQDLEILFEHTRRLRDTKVQASFQKLAPKTKVRKGD